MSESTILDQPTPSRRRALPLVNARSSAGRHDEAPSAPRNRRAGRPWPRSRRQGTGVARRARVARCRAASETSSVRWHRGATPKRRRCRPRRLWRSMTHRHRLRKERPLGEEPELVHGPHQERLDRVARIAQQEQTRECAGCRPRNALSRSHPTSDRVAALQSTIPVSS